MILPNLHQDSKVWVYQSSRVLNDADKLVLNDHLNSFIKEWASHGNQLYGAFTILHDRFVVLAVDESIAGVSGCSIDSSVRKIKDIGSELSIDFFDRLNLFIEKEGEFKRVHFSELSSYPDWNLYSTVERLKQLREDWKVQISASPYA